MVVPAVLKLVTTWQARGLPVLFTKFINPPGSAYERLIHWTRLRESPETDLHVDLATSGSTVIVKNQYSLFTPKARQLFKAKGWTSLAICGVATDGCVLKTAVDAFELGLTPYVVTDACASHAGREVHEAGLLLAGRFIGRDQLVTSDELLNVVGHS